MTVFTIDDARAEDIPALVGLLDILFSIEQDFTPDPLKQTQGLRMMLNRPDSAVIKVARNADGKAIGMVSAQLVISTAQGQPSAWLEDMVVNAEYRGTGIGRQLLDSALAWAKTHGATRAQLLVDSENAPAIAYYDHLGWLTTQLRARKLFL